MNVLDRFLKYISISSQSDENCEKCPSTGTQFEVAKVLVEELKAMGIEAEVDENCYVYATIPASKGRENEPAIGLIAHMDTAPAFSGDNIKPSIIENYDGKDIVLNKEKNIVMETAVFPHLLKYKGQRLVVTDGTTLLGADDKAGIAEIMTVAEILSKNEISHCAVKIGFTPDEEIGRGAKLFNVEKFGAEYAFTVDGGELGELEYENFNAAAAVITVNGNCIHPGEGKNRMKNAVLLAMEYNSMLPESETPARTEGYEGFYHILNCNGDEEKTVMQYIIRDHDRSVFETRKDRMNKIADYLNDKYGAGTIEIEIKDSYYNMKEKIEPHMEIIERAAKAFEQNGVTPITNPIRGGTDGATLSFMGLLCPNLSAGGHNFHGKFEYVPVESMEKMVQVLVTLVS